MLQDQRYGYFNLCQILDLTDDFVALISSEGRLEFLNRKARQITGSKDLPDLSEIFSSNSFSHIEDALSRVAKSTQATSVTVELRAENQTRTKSFGLSVSPIFADASREITSFVLCGRPSEVEELRSDLDAKERLMEDAGRLVMLGQISGQVIHEINNPMTVITGKAEKIVELAKEPAPCMRAIEECAEKIVRMAERTEKIIRSVKALAYRPNMQPDRLVSLRSLIEDVRDLIEVGSRRFSIEVRIPEISEEILVKADPVKLSQVFVNLICNSYDAVSRLEERWVELMVERDARWLTIRIVDSGQGIQPEVEERMFEGFFTTKEAGEGTGIGLSLSRQMIRTIGGDLFLDKNYRNTAFAIRLPRVNSADSDMETWEEI